MVKKCTTCKCKITNDLSSVNFQCPSCSEKEIVRCNNCRKTGSKYKCECEFEGP